MSIGFDNVDHNKDNNNKARSRKVPSDTNINADH